MQTISRTNQSRFTGKTALSNDDLRRVAPSVFASSPWHAMSERYRFVPTIEVVDLLRDRGFVVTQAMQSRSRIEGKGDFTKHMLRFRASEQVGTALAVGQELPELVLVNSHDGTSAYNLMAGIFRLVCSNGMIVQAADYGSVNVRHKGGRDFEQQIIDATFEVMDSAPRTMQQIETFRQIQLSPPVREAFSKAVLELTPDKPIRPAQLLTPRRSEDRAADLWSTSNVIQENMIRGGLHGLTPSAKRTTTREVKSVSENLRLNKAIWRLSEELSKILN